LCYVCHVLRRWGGEGSISDIKIEMILSEGWKGGCTCGLPAEFELKCIPEECLIVVSPSIKEVSPSTLLRQFHFFPRNPLTG